jgi:hypothetical protein
MTVKARLPMEGMGRTDGERPGVPAALRPPRRFRRFSPLMVLLILALASADLAFAQDFRWGGSARGFQFFRLEEAAGGERRDLELGILRMTSQAEFFSGFGLESHAVLNFFSPPLAGAFRLADSQGPAFLPLQRVLAEGDRAALLLHLDRLNLQMETPRVRIVAGRQPITWGVNYFWPAMDLFAPFAPQRVDRDYKPGVDAVRTVVPLGPYSELEIVAGSLGRSFSRSRAVAGLARIHLGRADLGLMGGTFHRDTVLGSFIAADVRGTGVRGEFTWTDSGDPLDELRDKGRFWRASAGVDRLLTPTVTVSGEFAWNGYGADDPAHYPALLMSDRFQRGEVTSVARVYSGGSLNWQFHPLVTLNQALLLNLDDGSLLLVPALRWLAGNNLELLLGGQVGLGEGLGPFGLPRSEYGSLPATVFAAFKGYF